MNKSDLVDAVANDSDMSKAQAARAVDSVLANVGDALGNGDSVSLVGLGPFSEDTELLVKVETHKLELQCILQLLKYLALKLVKV